MLEGLNPYPAMKDSGVPWLGKVPSHWDQLRGKWLFRHEKQLNGNRPNSNVLSLTLRGVVNNDPDDPEGLVPKDYATYQLFCKGDLVFKLIDLENLRTSRVGLVPEDGIMSSAYVRLTPRTALNIRYFFHQYFDLYQRGIYNQLGAGVRSTLGPDDLLELDLVVPPPDEQSAIVRFLDHADQRIRSYIRAKQKLIKLLEEQRQAIIHRVVTRGLDPNVRLKPSGVEWLGDVPMHWDVIKLGRLIRLTTGFPFKSEGFSDNEADVKLLRGINVTPGCIQWNSIVRWPRSDSDSFTAFTLNVGDVVLGMDRPLISAGTRVAQIQREDVPALLLQRVARIRPASGLDNEYMLLILRGKHFSDYLAPIFTGISVPHVSPEQIRNFQIALPPVGKQREIVRWAKEHTGTLATAISCAIKEVSLVREYRDRLISDVVTGKLDLREVSGTLSEEFQESSAVIESEELTDESDAQDEPDLEEATEEAEP